jgi:hypothetical protein
MDPENAIVKLCAAGMDAEGRGDMLEAQRLFTEAWMTAHDDFEACIAAHYVARHQTRAEDRLTWNETALRLAEAVGDKRVEGFLGSLLLNVGRAHEDLGNLADAGRFYGLAADRAAALCSDGYGRMVRKGAAAGLRRLGVTHTPGSEDAAELSHAPEPAQPA